MMPSAEPAVQGRGLGAASTGQLPPPISDAMRGFSRRPSVITWKMRSSTCSAVTGRIRMSSADSNSH